MWVDALVLEHWAMVHCPRTALRIKPIGEPVLTSEPKPWNQAPDEDMGQVLPLPRGVWSAEELTRTDRRPDCSIFVRKVQRAAASMIVVLLCCVLEISGVNATHQRGNFPNFQRARIRPVIVI